MWRTFDFKSNRTRLGQKMGKILEDNEFKCSLCTGTGILPRSKGTKCPVCNGVGIVSFHGPVVVCAYCKGRGNYPARTNMSCTVCKGKGLVSITEPITICQYCRGTGAERGNKLPCLKCRGKGVVTKQNNQEQEVLKWLTK